MVPHGPRRAAFQLWQAPWSTTAPNLHCNMFWKSVSGYTDPEMHVRGEACASCLAARAANANGVGMGGGTEVGAMGQVGVDMGKVRLNVTKWIVWTKLSTRL